MGKTTLERYMRIKTTLKSEWFLGESRVWVRRWVKMRESASCLEVTVARWKNLALEKRVCGWCESEEVEDEEHFLDGCEGGKSGRREVWDEMRVGGDEQRVIRVEGEGREERVDWMMKGGSSVRTRGLLIRAVGRWLFRRETKGRGRFGRGWVKGDRVEKRKVRAGRGRVVVREAVREREGEGEGEQESDSETETDTESDSDSGSETETDTENDSDSGSETETDTASSVLSSSSLASSLASIVS